MEMDQQQTDTLRQLVEDAMKNPGEFAVLSKNMPSQLLVHMHTLLIVALLNLAGIQQQEIEELKKDARTNAAY